MHSSQTANALWLVVAAAGCEAAIPDQPTYFADVQPILQANCARCHGADPWDAKIAKYRLDRSVAGDADLDAWEYAQQEPGGDPAAIIRVAVDHEAPAMPPGYELTDRQQRILARWVENGAPKGERTNHAPRIELISSTVDDAEYQSMTVVLRDWDDDRDGIVAQLWAHDVATSAAEDVPVSARFGAGRRTIVVDTGQLASLHTFEIYATLDDGFFDYAAGVTGNPNEVTRTVIGDMFVDHGPRGTAPTVTLLSPNGGETLIGTADIAWSASDPDVGDSLTIDLDLVVDGTTTVASSIATGIPNASPFRWTIPGDLSPTTLYRLRVTATDAGAKNTRSDLSDDTVTIAKVTTTTYTWADVEPIFSEFCLECHGQPARTAALESSRFDKYDASDPIAPINADLGVYEMRTQIYSRMVVQGSMPPAAKPKPTQAQRDMVGDWIQGGAPRGGGPADPRPTFTWIKPSAPQSTGATVALEWSAADNAGLASGVIEYKKVNGTPATGCGMAGTTGWATVTDPMAMATLGGATAWTGAFTWTLPNTTTGYYCFRARVTDTAAPVAQETLVLNPNGVK